MEEIQFLNYILSLVAVLLGVYAVYVTNNSEKEKEELKKELLKLQQRIIEIKQGDKNVKKY